MARLLGFAKTKTAGEKKVSEDQLLRILEASYLNSTVGGEYNTPEDVQGMIDKLSSLPQTPDTMEKIVTLNNKKLQISARLTDVMAQKGVFDSDLQAGLDGAARNNFKNVKNLIGSYAAIYGDAAERYDNEVLKNITQRYGAESNIPPENLAYRKTLADKAKFFAQLFNSYNVRDPKTGEVGALDTSGIAMQIDTNPTTGAVQRIDIMPSGQVDNKSYMRTDAGINVVDGLPNKKLPVYLRVNDIGVDDTGKTIRGGSLGNITYQEKFNEGANGAMSTANILEPKKASVGLWNKIDFWSSDTPDEKLNDSIDSIKNNGINFSNPSYKYDSNDVPNGNVLKMGNRVFYSTDKDNQILEITGKNASEKDDNLKKYLSSIGKDPAKVSPYFITKDYLTAPDGNSRVQGQIDANYLAPSNAPSQPDAFTPTVQPQQQADTMTEAGADMRDKFFSSPLSNPAKQSSAVNRPNKPDVSAEGTKTSSSIGDIVEKGKSFFRKFA